MYKYKRLRGESQLRLHHGIFHKELSLWEATALMVPIGAGVLGIPYAVAQVGLVIGVAYIIGLGFLMMGLNFLVGEVMLRTKGNHQLIGLAKKYLGAPGEIVMGLVVYLMLFGALVVYIIGVGEALAALFPGGSFAWSLMFFFFGSLLVFFGLRTIKRAELFLLLFIFLVVVVIIFFAAPHVQFDNIRHVNLAALFFPYGIVLFAFHGTTSIPEAHSLLSHRPADFYKALTRAILIAMVIYVVFAVAVVGVTGVATSEIATIGLGRTVGPAMLWLGNIFAVLSMATSFLMVGVSLSDSFAWDFKLPRFLARLLVCGVPLIIFLLGFRHFIMAVDIVGGVFGSIELLLLILIYWRAKHLGDLSPGKYKVHHAALLVGLLVFAFTVGAVYSVIKLF